MTKEKSSKIYKGAPQTCNNKKAIRYYALFIWTKHLRRIMLFNDMYYSVQF